MLYDSDFEFHPAARRIQPDSLEIQPHRTPASSFRAGRNRVLTKMNIPDGPEELTPGWLTEALRDTGVITEAAVRSVRVDPAAVRKGNLGRLNRIVLQYDRGEPGAPVSMVTKFHPFEIELREFVAEANRTEVRFYEQVAPNIQMRTPRRYFSAFDEDSGRSLLLLEDLGGHRVADEIPGCTVAEAERITDSLANLHAKWWDSPALDQLDWLQPFNKSFSVAIAGHPARSFDGPLPESVRAIGAVIKERYMYLFDLQSRPPLTVALNDIKIRHVLFSPEPGSGDFAVVDFQLVVRARGVLDLARFYGGSLDTELRRSSEIKLLRSYHDSLLANGVEGYAFDECLTDYRLGHLQNLADLMAIEAQRLQQRGGDRAVQIQKVQLERYAAAITDLDCGDLLASA